MAHVELKTKADGTGTLIVDGVDLSLYVNADVRVEFGPDPAPARVHVVIPAHTLDVEIPDALLSAVQGADE